MDMDLVEVTEKIRELLRLHPEGLSITSISSLSRVNYPALKDGASCFILPLLRQVHRLYGAFRTCYSDKVLFLQGKFLDIDCRVDVTVVVSAAVGTDPFPV